MFQFTFEVAMKVTGFYLLIIFTFFLAKPVNSTTGFEDVRQTNTLEVISSSAQFLAMAGSQYINLEGLVWVGGGLPWMEVVGNRVVFQPVAGKNKEYIQDRYGGLKGKILMPPHGWMQKYWIGKGKAVLSGAGHYPKMVLQALLQAEKEARALKAGRWAHWAPIQAAETDAFSGREGFQIIEGQVKEIRKIRGVSYLNFGTDWKSDFTAAISSKNRINFKRVGWKLADLVNKWVRVRGRVRSYNGPYVELIFPEQIEILE